MVQRGCASTLNTADFATCSSNSAECKICHGEACNMKGEKLIKNILGIEKVFNNENSHI